MPKRKYIENEDGTIYCPKCKNDFDKSHFHTTVDRKGKYKGKVNYYCLIGNKNFNSGGRSRRKNNNYLYNSKEYSRFYRMIREFGISLDVYNEFFNKQQGCCAICGIHQIQINKSLCVDHCHNSGKVRGLLCMKCNTGIGNANDSIEILQKFITYLNAQPIKFNKSSTREKFNSENPNNNRYFKDKLLQKRFKISLADYENLLKMQNSTCSICNKQESSMDKKSNKIRMLSVDHNHTTGEIRGLLCRGCNTSIGLLDDNITLIQKAIKYLQNHDL
jgi:hypothetical protein